MLQSIQPKASGAKARADSKLSTRLTHLVHDGLLQDLRNHLLVAARAPSSATWLLSRSAVARGRLSVSCTCIGAWHQREGRVQKGVRAAKACRKEHTLRLLLLAVLTLRLTVTCAAHMVSDTRHQSR